MTALLLALTLGLLTTVSSALKSAGFYNPRQGRIGAWAMHASQLVETGQTPLELPI